MKNLLTLIFCFTLISTRQLLSNDLVCTSASAILPDIDTHWRHLWHFWLTLLALQLNFWESSAVQQTTVIYFSKWVQRRSSRGRTVVVYVPQAASNPWVFPSLSPRLGLTVDNRSVSHKCTPHANTVLSTGNQRRGRRPRRRSLSKAIDEHAKGRRRGRSTGESGLKEGVVVDTNKNNIIGVVDFFQ